VERFWRPDVVADALVAEGKVAPVPAEADLDRVENAVVIDADEDEAKRAAKMTSEDADEAVVSVFI